MGIGFVNFRKYMKLNRGGGYTSHASSALKAPAIRRVKRKRVLLFFILFLLALNYLSASSLIWSWSSTDENIEYYRYKTDETSSWTVVDGSTTSVNLPSDKTKIYIEASYDGRTWSETRVGTYSNLKDEERDEQLAAIKADSAQKEEVVALNNDDIGLVRVTWNNTDDYTFIRYQRDGESIDGWTEIDGSEESIVLPYHKGLNSYYLQSSFDGTSWSESSVAYYRYQGEPYKKVVIENLLFGDEDQFAYSQENPSITVSENETDSNHLSYSWNTEGYNYLKFRIDDEPWYIVDTHTTGVLLRLIENYDKDNAVFQIKASVDGKKWTERKTINDRENKYNEAYMNREGWVISSAFSVYHPYLVAFFTPAKGTINYTTPRELTTEDIKVSFGGEIGSKYETEKGNSYGFNIRYIYSPTHKADPYTSLSLELMYSRLLLRTKKYNTFQLWLDAGLGPSICLFQNTGSFGVSMTLSLEARFTFSNNLVLFSSYDNTIIIEPNYNDKDQLTLGTTFYTTLPLKIGFSYSFKEVKD